MCIRDRIILDVLTSINYKKVRMADNENNINETTSVENFDESNMSNFEIHSTPSASQEKTELNFK